MIHLAYFYDRMPFLTSITFVCVENAYILEREDVVESDHAAVGVNVEWKVRKREHAE